MTDRRAHELLNRLLLDVPLARGTGDPRALLTALVDAAAYTPVFLDGPSPVPGWLDEAEPLAARLGDSEAAALVHVRRAEVLMRQGRLDEAHNLLDRSAESELSASLRSYAVLTRCRVETRLGDLDAARASLEEATTAPEPEIDWIAALRPVARGELLLQRGDHEPARSALTAARRALPERRVEDRVQVLQGLGFLRIAERDARAAERLLDEARGLLEAAGAWPEVVQMAVVVANLRIAEGRPGAAEPLLEDALATAREHGLTLWEPLLELGLARAHTGRESFGEARDAVLRAATSFARRGDAVGYFAMVTYLSGIHQRAGEPAETYRVLALGVSIAKRLRIATAEEALRSQIAALREGMGADRFDAMVEELLERDGSENGEGS